MGAQEDLGKIDVNDDVVALIASIAMGEVDGVVSLTGKRGFSDYQGLRSKDVEKGVLVKTDPSNNNCTVTVEINVEYGVSIYDTARKLQRAIKNNIETMVGLSVDRVNVTIKGLLMLDPPAPTTVAKSGKAA